jgi:ABC-type nitrate/sulfonate/bicarbonate transport system ATPase subunit/ABC-type spermidine/putrescine transport system permease subunit II
MNHEKMAALRWRGPTAVNTRLVAGFAFALLAPYVLLILLSLGSGWSFPNLAPNRLDASPWRRWTTERDGLASSLAMSIVLGAVVGTAATTGGFLMARSFRGPLSGAWRFIAYLPFVVSPVVLGATLYRPLAWAGLAGTAAGVSTVQTLVSTAMAAVFFSESQDSRGERLEMLAESLGGGLFAIWRYVIWPSNRGLFVVAFAQAALFSWMDYGLASLVGGGQVPTLTVRLFATLREANVNLAALAALTLIAPVACGAFAAAFFFGRPTERGTNVPRNEPGPFDTRDTTELSSPHAGGCLLVDRLVVEYAGRPIVEEATFRVEPGKTLVIFGESGCGKTTLLRTLAGMVQPRSGTARLDELDLLQTTPRESRVLYLDQEPLLFEQMTVERNLAFAPRMRGDSPTQIDADVNAMLAALGLVEHRLKNDGQISGGQRQRVAFGRAVLARPRLLLLDEPFGSLDTQTRGRMQTLFADLCRRWRLTAVFVTHDPKEALIVGDVFARMAHGKLHGYPTAADFAADPATGVPAEIDFWRSRMSE